MSLGDICKRGHCGILSRQRGQPEAVDEKEPETAGTRRPPELKLRHVVIHRVA